MEGDLRQGMPEASLILAELRALSASHRDERVRAEASLTELRAGQREATDYVATIKEELKELSARLDELRREDGARKPEGQGEPVALDVAIDYSRLETTRTRSVRPGSDAPSNASGAWPTRLAIRAAVVGKTSQSSQNGVGMVNRRRGLECLTRGDLLSEEEPVGEESKRQPFGCTQRHFVIDPTSGFKQGLDICGVVALGFDVTVIPFILAWDIKPGPITIGMVITTSFWTFDLLCSCITGYYTDGTLQKEPLKVMRRYLATWFLPNFVLVFADWMSLLSESASQLRLLRITKVGRCMRIFGGIMRMLRFAQFVEDLLESSISEQLHLSAKVATLVSFLLWVTHIIGCMWFALGRLAPTDTGGHWSDIHVAYQPVDGVTHGPLESATHFYQYITSFHWAASQLTLGGIEIACQNGAERLFAVIVIMSGLIFSSTLVSSLSAAMVDVQATGRERKQKLLRVRQYLSENSIDRRLKEVVYKKVRARLVEKQRLTDKDVPSLQLLPQALRLELRAAAFLPHVINHPLFRLWASMDTDAIQRFCMEACDFAFPSVQDEIFYSGQQGGTAFYIVSGEVQYTQDPATAPCDFLEVQTVRRGGWMCEAALWSEWEHVGTAEARTRCQLVTIQAEAMSTLARGYPAVLLVCKAYCINFHKRIVSAVPPNSPYPNDIVVPFTDYGDLVVSMEKDAQIAIGLNALATLAKSSAWGWTHLVNSSSSSRLEALKDEVLSGKCTVLLDGAGEVRRVVSVLALRITEGNEGVFLARIGKNESSGLCPSCQLPGGKQERGELPSDAAKRLLEQKLAPLAQNTSVVRWEREVTEKRSKEHGVLSKYLRTVCVAKLTDPLSTPTCRVKRLSVRGAAVVRGRNVADLLVGGPVTLEACLAKTVYIIHEGGKDRAACLYAWLTAKEFEHLSAPAGEALLHEWVSTLDFDRDPQQPEEFFDLTVDSDDVMDI